ncbi:MAG: T9SS type A sorting domain-containing protein [candidate division Zixibacteria bacterium]|nr:T9SS type A sorting domain-containing protein [candidate division Zixibacteria bacterium]
MRTGKSYLFVTLIGLLLGLVMVSHSFLSLWAKILPDSSRTLATSTSITVTVVVANQSLLPEAFSLSQNYPNPFNPQTVIKYTLPKDCHVELTIYNTLGQKVKTLVNQYQSAGYKMVHWNSTNDKGNEVSSGIYFYKIKAGRYTDVKKMMVLK